MSNYTKATNFATKDALTTGNPLKTLSGTELDDEFNAIQVANATKANASNAALTGVPVAPTAAANTNTTQVATTAFVTTEANLKADLASPTFTGVPAAPTAVADTNTTQVATTAFVTTEAALKADLAGAAFTGAITTTSTIDGIDIATRDAVLTTTTTTADAALPKAGGAMTGAITTTSTFDGRDVAADGVLATNAMPKSGGAFTGAVTTNSTVDGVDIATRDGVLSTTTTTANAALPKAGGTMTGVIAGFDSTGIADNATATKLTVADTGIDVTGTVTADGLVVDGDSLIKGGSGVDNGGGTLLIDSSESLAAGIGGSISLRADDGSGTQRTFGVIKGSKDSATSSNFSGGLDFYTRVSGVGDAQKRMALKSNGDISFYEPTGTNAKFFWDSSAESLKLSGTGGLELGFDQPIQIGSATYPLKISRSAAGSLVSTISDGYDVSNTRIDFVMREGSAYEVTPLSITASGNVGIGTSSPRTSLNVTAASSDSPALGTASGGLTIAQVSNGYGLNMGVEGSGTSWIQAMRFDGTATAYSLALQANGGNVGIGTSSPTSMLHLAPIAYSTNQSDGITLSNTSNSTWDSSILLESDATGTPHLVINSPASSRSITMGTDGVIFKNDSTASMTIDTSGNVLVGKTSSTYDNTAGLGLFPSGRVYATRDSGNLLYLNRTGSDGDVASFQKDSTSVGSIGAYSSDLHIGKGYTALRFYDTGSAILPRTTGGANVNGLIDLGGDTGVAGQFKDLYLSGGVYLGGTGSANKLDDYEEGTWNPVITGSLTTGTPTYSVQEGQYTKVGNLVTVTGRLVLTSLGSAYGDIEITGLPFTSQSTHSTPISVSDTDSLNLGSAMGVGGYVTASATVIALSVNDDVYGDTVLSSNRLSSNGELSFSGTYQTN